MYTLQNIKDEWYAELSSGDVTIGFEEYLREHYENVYNASLDFLGYERRSVL